ncbi:MAG: alpha-L-rhamnosidase C-terminal domain-containing protein [Mariniphaga sp.]
MVKIKGFTILFFLLYFAAFTGNCQTNPTGLMVDFLRNPSVGFVSDPLPNFSWIAGGSKGNSQRNYQILVSVSPKRLESGEGDVWNSGKIASDQSVGVKFKGVPLVPNTHYFWRVTIWNSNSATGMKSEIQEFQTGSFEKEYQTSVIPLTKNTIQPRLIIKRNSQGNYFADFGKAAFGTLRLQIDSKGNDSVVVHLGEKLSAPGIINRIPGGNIRYRQIVLAVAKGTQWVTLSIPRNPRTSKYPAILMPAEIGEVTPFRYCEIESRSESTVCKSIEQIAVNYYWDDTQSSFSCSDTVLTKVWDLCKYSIKATTFCGVYVDGDRERIPYEADAYINQLGHYCTDREYSMARYSHEYLMVNPTWPTEWILHSVMMAYADYLYTGDTESLRHFYKDLKNKTLLALAREDGLISTQTGLLNEAVLLGIHMKAPIRDVVDWPAVERDGNEMPKVNTVVNSFHYESLRIMSLIAKVLDNSDDELLYKKKAAAVKNVINQKLFDKISRKYVDGEGSTHSSLHANIFPMAFGLVPETSVADVAQFIKSKGMACSVYAAQFLLEALYAAGEDKAALDLMRSTTDRSWWNMIQSGSTITLEAWDIKYKSNLDWNHAWGSAPANMVARGLWGIIPLTPGFGTAQIKPQTGGLISSKIKVPTIRGSINCGFHTNNTTQFDLLVSSPSNMKMVVYIPVRELIDPVLFIDGKEVQGTRKGKFFVSESHGGEFNFSVRNRQCNSKLQK